MMDAHVDAPSYSHLVFTEERAQKTNIKSKASFLYGPFEKDLKRNLSMYTGTCMSFSMSFSSMQRIYLIFLFARLFFFHVHMCNV